jgi:hypothetical protein
MNIAREPKVVIAGANFLLAGIKDRPALTAGITRM